MTPLIPEHCGHLGCNTVLFSLEFRLKAEYNGTYTFEVFVPVASCTRDVPCVERDEAQDECPFAKLDGVVPTRY
jgi:hypothetical protein